MPRQLKSLTHMVANREHEQNMPDHFWANKCGLDA